MQSPNLDDQGGGKAAIFYKGKHWKRMPREGSPGAAAQWFRLRYTTDRLEAADSEMWHFLEDIYRRPERANPVRRYPRLSAEDAAAAASVEDRVAQLDAQILRSIARRREATIEAGRAFIELKKILDHGKWQAHFAETFAPCGISLRTAERWMRRANKADAASKIDNVSILKPATDRGAQDIREATERAQAEVDASSRQGKLKKQTRLYRLPLHMTEAEKQAMDALQKSSDWPRAEKKILHFLRRLCIEYASSTKTTEDAHEDPHAEA